MRLKVFFLVMVFGCGNLLQAEIVVMNDQKRLEAIISKEVMNRIAVEQDRIVNVFGDEGTFVTQTDEASGQIFLKPTVENGEKPLSLTLITEQGKTQDLTLKPTDQNAQTVILKPSLSTSSSPEVLKTSEAISEKALPYPNQLLHLVRQVFFQKIVPTEQGRGEHVCPLGFELSYQSSYVLEGRYAHVFLVTNTSDKKKLLEEKDFYQDGDRAIAFLKTTLSPQESTQMVTVCDF